MSVFLLNFLSYCRYVSFQDKVYLGFRFSNLHDFIRPFGLDRVRSSIGSGVSFQVGFWDEPDFGVSLQLRPDFESGSWAESRDFGVNLGGPLLDRRLGSVSYTHLRAHETDSYLVCR